MVEQSYEHHCEFSFYSDFINWQKAAAYLLSCPILSFAIKALCTTHMQPAGNYPTGSTVRYCADVLTAVGDKSML
ncbi:MAG: hypothetical protein JWO13_1188 [Acidobacteriales bacterium]|nr:hypothetical protein [Terriglobales bacterium]